MRTKTIAEFIEGKLKRFNSEHAGVKNVAANPDCGIERVARTIDKLNADIAKMAVEINGQDFDQNRVPRFPNNFKKQPFGLYQCLGANLAIEILE